MSEKTRLSATVDADLLAEAQRAVSAGRVGSVSAWVNDALRLKHAQEQRLVAMDGLLREYEAEHGEITDEEMHAAARRVRERATVVRGPGRTVA